MSCPRRCEVDPGPLVLALVDAHAEAEHEAPAREQLERRRLLGDGGGLPQGELQHAGPERGPVRRRGGDGQGGQGLADGMGPEEMVDRPQGVGTRGLGSAAQLDQLRRHCR